LGGPSSDFVPERFDRTKAEKEIAGLRQELGDLGEVNVGSIYLYDRLSTRKSFLREQILDLEQGKDSLQRALQEIDQRTRSQFLTTFKRVGEEFQRLFQRLFEGGETELALTDADNLLETGVEVQVRLPGKEMINLLSLSGGERSLTAVAFLFSLLMVRPSPFCVLDEVDASLDEANTRKFASLLEDMSGKTQFLVITHNPLTMESANYLYGVTVGESGASKLLSVRLAQRATAQPSLT
jgi:chromosome segregation protein